MQTVDGRAIYLTGMYISNVQNVDVMNMRNGGIRLNWKNEVTTLLMLAIVIAVALLYLVVDSEGFKFLLFGICLIYAVDYFFSWIKEKY